ncbi:FecCD family ABC transporter permease [Candidatus Protochlamydia phocaeensis]|uniref:FecCD family ABC transporter permease n=1 Tax=Candidatus Protochlamydia phocaeensis TaxID=1414722 RepID=UPI0008392A1D|nr:iron ABC transporter permease [Candidatus Protochlamydia phocaeensis]
MKHRYSLYLWGFALLFLASSTWTLMTGETPWNQVWEGFQLRLHNLSSQWNPLLDERLPRLIVLACTGASLAVSGAVMQSLFHNPLASPSVLGISAGGCLSVVLVFIFDLRFTYPYSLPLAAFLGCLLTLCVVYLLSRLQEGAHLTNLILTGIAVSTIIIATQSLLLYALRDRWQLIQTITEWEAGTTIDRGWQHVHMQFPLTVVGLWGCWMYRREMNILALGEEEAKNLGVDVQRVRWRLFLCISLLTGGALAAIGMIAFFGLVLPHIIRRLQGPDHNELIPLCLVSGAAVLTTLDVLLRGFGLYAISIGNFSAIIGGIFFLFLLFRSHKRTAF